MGKHLHTGCGQMLERETVASWRYSDTLHEALSNVTHLRSESCLEQGLDRRPPATPPNPNCSSLEAAQLPSHLEEVLGCPSGQPWEGAVPLGKRRMEKTIWKARGSCAVPAPNAGARGAFGATRQSSLRCSLSQGNDIQ